MNNTYKTWIYPGGEVGVRLNELINHNNFGTFRLHNANDLVGMLMALDAYKEETGTYRSSVVIPYIPYARQDRVATKGDPLAIRVLARMLKSVNIHVVYTVDIHSDKSIKVFNDEGISLISHSPSRFISEYLRKIQVLPKHVAFVAPDKGAHDKVTAYCQKLGVESAIQCDKKRDPITGKLTGFEVNTSISSTKERLEREKITNLVITDDICDGGGTFHGVAAALREVYGHDFKLHLWTSHGIYSKGVDDLLKTFNTLGCTNSFVNAFVETPNVHTIVAFY